MRALVYIYRHVHIKTRQRRMYHALLRRIIQAHKLHESFHLIVCCKRRVPEDICHVGIAKHIESASHLQIVETSSNEAEEVNVRLTERHASVVLLRVDKLIVLCPHPHVHHYAVEVGKVYVTIYIKRVVVVAVNLEVLEKQLAVNHPYGVVAESERHTVWNTYERCGVEIHFSVDNRFVERPSD